VIESYIQVGISTNNTIKKGDPEINGAEPGDANGPVAVPSDADVPMLNGIETYIHRNAHSNIVVGVTPTPAPMGKKFDWGFLSDTTYGRNPKGCVMAGFDANWPMNASAQYDAYDRYTGR